MAIHMARNWHTILCRVFKFNQPYILRKQIMLALLKLQAPLFRGLNPGFKRMLSLVIRPVFYMPNQIIASKGDIGHHMFYIHRGRAEVCFVDLNYILM